MVGKRSTKGIAEKGKLWLPLLLVLMLVACTPTIRYEDYLKTLPIKPLSSTTEIAVLTVEERSIVKCVVDSFVESQTEPENFTYYLKVFGKNPDESTLISLKAEKIKFRSASEGRLRGDDMVIDSEGYRAKLLSIDRIDIAGGTARVTLSTYTAPLSSALHECELSRKDQNWKVVRWRLRAIS